MVSIEKVKELRKLTGISFGECYKALEKANDDISVARGFLKDKEAEMAAKKKDRNTGEGSIISYIHNNKKIGSLVEIRCETDFVASSDKFQSLGKDIAVQIVASSPEDVTDLLSQPFFRNEEQTVASLINSLVAEVGENIRVEKFVRFEI